jgi:hypothetical protein
MKKGRLRVKALVWFWLINETYVLTFVTSGDLSKVGTIQVIELDDGHGDKGCIKMIKCFTFGKEKREKQKRA